MGYVSYVGRVGALAVALGVGSAVATMPGVALAEPSDSGPSSTPAARALAFAAPTARGPVFEIVPSADTDPSVVYFSRSGA